MTTALRTLGVLLYSAGVMLAAFILTAWSFDIVRF